MPSLPADRLQSFDRLLSASPSHPHQRLPSKREGYPSRSSQTPPCGITAAGSSGRLTRWTKRGRCVEPEGDSA
jgi:hypothetical protein